MKHRLGLLALAFGLFFVFAQEAASPTVRVGSTARWGQHLTDADGNSLYIYLQDEQDSGESVCVDVCTRNWPPFTVEGEPIAGDAVDATLLGTIERPDGTRQVTYDGWPLYYYARDAEPGHTRGQRLGQVFFLVGPAGETIAEEIGQEVVEIDEETFAQLMTVGENSYDVNCASCHGAEGEGAFGPRMANNSNLARASFVAGRIIHGFVEHSMPPFGHLSDEEIAGISTYIRNSWGNEFGAVLPEEVAEQR